MYNLAEQTLLKTLTPGTRWISSMDVHPSGDHLIVGGYDRKLCWFDLELSDKPYKILRYVNPLLYQLFFRPSMYVSVCTARVMLARSSDTDRRRMWQRPIPPPSFLISPFSSNPPSGQ